MPSKLIVDKEIVDLIIQVAGRDYLCGRENCGQPAYMLELVDSTTKRDNIKEPFRSLFLAFLS